MTSNLLVIVSKVIMQVIVKCNSSEAINSSVTGKKACLD